MYVSDSKLGQSATLVRITITTTSTATSIIYQLSSNVTILSLCLQLEKEGKFLHPPRSPNTSHSNNSTLETKSKGGIKKIIADKIITTTTLERGKKEKKDGQTTLERENEKNSKLANKPRSETKHDKTKTRYSDIIQPENGISHFEHAEVQKRDYDPKRGMKFGIRVLPPNIPDDGVLNKHTKNVENGVVTNDVKSRDEIDKPKPITQIKHETETEPKSKPVVAKRRERMAPPIPNARVKTADSDSNSSQNTTKTSDSTSFNRSDLNSSGIKRDENGIPQELPQHMFEAAKAARFNRRSSTEYIDEKEKSDIKYDQKAAKKTKGKAPSPPENEKNKTDDSMIEHLKNIDDFLKNEKLHSSLLYEYTLLSTPNKSTSNYNTSTPKVNKLKGQSRNEDSINFSQEDIDDIVSKPFKRESDSLNNFYEDSKSNMSSNLDMNSVVSLNNSDRSEVGSTTIELNNSDITIHSSPLNETVHSGSDNTSVLEDNERKAASLGDLSRFDLRMKANIPSTGTLERAQSLDISADDVDTNDAKSPKKRKANSVVETNFFESSSGDVLPDMNESDRGLHKHKEPRLSLNIAKTSAMEGLNTFQRNRLKKGSEFGNLEDAIVKDSSSSLDSDKTESYGSVNKLRKAANQNLGEDVNETSDHLAKRIMDENLKVHLKLVSEFAKSTSGASTESSPQSSPESKAAPSKRDQVSHKYDEKIATSYDTNIPDDMKVSRSSYVNSLERPKSDMMKKLLAKNPILNVHIDQGQEHQNEPTKTIPETPTPMTDASKSAMHQPDIVNFDLKSTEPSRDYDDFVSNIRVGSNNNSLNYSKKPLLDSFMEWTDQVPKSSTNVVTVNTNDKSPSSPTERHKEAKSYTKSIEIGEPKKRQVPDVVEGIKRRVDDDDSSRGSRTLYMEPPSMAITMTQEPVQKTVTVNVAEDEFGNKVITQNVEKVSSKYNVSSDPPLQVEQFSFGLIRNPSDIQQLNIAGANTDEEDQRILETIKKQNPNMHFTTDEPSYSKTETIILNTQLDEEQAVALMEKIKNDPTFMAQKSPEELSELGIKIIHDLEDIQHESHDTVEVTKTRYSFAPPTIPIGQQCNDDIDQQKAIQSHITEIQVTSPKLKKQKSEEEKILNRQRAPAQIEPPLTYELDISLLNDFITNERHHTDKQEEKSTRKRTKSTDSIDESRKRHSDFDLPRNSHIKFRTATYESPKGTLVTSTDLDNRRQSQIDQLRTSFEGADKPVISSKPSSIPIKTGEKAKQAGVSSKIPVFMSQKSLSQENLTDKQFSLPQSPPPRLSASTSSGNISVTSIKSSSKNPSGKL